MQIYKTTNKINGKIYIGQDSKCNPEYLGSGSLIRRSIRKYGKENFEKEILEDNIICKKILNERETYWIEHFDSTNKLIGYNIMSKGWQYERTEESLKKQKEYFENRTEEERKKTSELMSKMIKIAFSTSEMKEKISDKNKKLWENESYRNKVTESNKDYWSNISNKNKQSIIMKEILNDSDYKKKLSNSLKNMDKLKCPHCNKTMAKNHARGKHFDNCIHHKDQVKKEIAINRWDSIINDTKKSKCSHCNMESTINNINRWHNDNCKLKN